MTVYVVMGKAISDYESHIQGAFEGVEDAERTLSNLMELGYQELHIEEICLQKKSKRPVACF